MKARLFLLMTAIALALPLRAQVSDDNYKTIDEAKLIVNYTLTYRFDSTAPKIGKQEDMILLIGNEISSFQSFGYYRYREFQMTRPNASAIEYEQMARETMSDIRYRIYKNYPKGMITVMERVPWIISSMRKTSLTLVGKSRKTRCALKAIWRKRLYVNMADALGKHGSLRNCPSMTVHTSSAACPDLSST